MNDMKDLMKGVLLVLLMMPQGMKMPQTGETTTETWGSQMIQWLKAKGFIRK